MNPAQRRKFNEIDMNTDGERCAKLPRLEIVVNEKELNVPVGPAVTVPFGDGVPQNAPMQVSGQFPHEVMDCVVSPHQPNGMSQQTMAAVASAGAGGQSLAAPSAAAHGVCLQCYYGQSGHFHHIETRIFPTGNQ